MQLTGTTPEDLAKAARRRKRILWIVVSMLVIGGVFGSIVYKPWRLKSLNRASREAIEKGDHRGAAFFARRALEIDPNFAPACIIMAEVGEHEQASGAVFWRERVLNLVGESTDTLIGLASTALRFGKIPTARYALERIPEKDRAREDFLVLSGAMAMEERDYVASVRNYEAALRLNPGNEEYRLALGRAKCASEDYVTRDEGRRVLQELTAHETHGLTATRLLIAYFEAHQEFQAALRHAEQLILLPSHAFTDEVLRLRLLRKTDSPKFADELAKAQEKVKTDPKHAGALLLWMSMDGLAKEGLEWVLRRVPRLGQSPELRPAVSGCHLALSDWSAVLAVTQMGAWDYAEYVRHAYRARAFHETSEPLQARKEWGFAIDSADRQIENLTSLVQMATEWKWAEELEMALWAVLNEVPGSRWAIDALQKSYLEKNNTLGLRRIALHLVKLDPTDENAQNDLALVSLLLDVETDRAMKIAQDLYDKHPDNPAFNSTYAFALHTTGRTVDALEVLEKLPPERLKEPAIAAYYGILLASNLAPEKASYFLEIGRQATLLPEEKNLIANAEEKIRDSIK